MKQASVHPSTVKLPGTLTPVGSTRALTESLQTDNTRQRSQLVQNAQCAEKLT